MMISKVYSAYRKAGVSEEDARLTAEVLSAELIANTFLQLGV